MDANTLLTTTYAEHIPLCLGPCRLSSISPALDATRWRLSAWSPLRVPTFLALRAQADNCRHLVPRWSHSTAKSIDTIIYKKNPLCPNHGLQLCQLRLAQTIRQRRIGGASNYLTGLPSSVTKLESHSAMLKRDAPLVLR